MILNIADLCFAAPNTIGMNPSRFVTFGRRRVECVVIGSTAACTVICEI